MVNNFVPRGFTDLSEMKEMMKYSNNATAELTKNNSNLTEKQKIEIRNKQDLTAMAIKNVQKRKAKEGTSGTPYNSGMPACQRHPAMHDPDEFFLWTLHFPAGRLWFQSE
jgi:hypothetical protein